MGALDIPLETIMLILSAALVYLAYNFYAKIPENQKNSALAFFLGFWLLFISGAFDLWDEFSASAAVDLAGEAGLIAAFAIFAISLFMLTGSRGEKK